MINLALFAEAPPSTATIGLIVAVTFLLLFLGAAYVAFRALKRTVKMAVRLAIVGAILVIAVVGSISLWYFSSGGSPKMKPPVERRR